MNFCRVACVHCSRFSDGVGGSRRAVVRDPSFMGVLPLKWSSYPKRSAHLSYDAIVSDGV